jgi:hypothetical protein
MPQWQYDHEEWHLTFFAIPRAPGRRGLPGVRPLAVQMPGVEIDRSVETIRRAVNEKASRYGDLDRPYVIAVNILEFPHAEAMSEALFGKPQWPVTMTEAGPRVEGPIRSLDGVWVDRQGRVTPVSAQSLQQCGFPSVEPHRARVSACTSIPGRRCRSSLLWKDFRERSWSRKH